MNKPFKIRIYHTDRGALRGTCKAEEYFSTFRAVHTRYMELYQKSLGPYNPTVWKRDDTVPGGWDRIMGY